MSTPAAPGATRVRGTGPWMYEATVGHARRAPVVHGFAHALRPWLVDLDALGDDGRPTAVPRWLRPVASFRAADHFDGSAPTLRAAVDRWCEAHGEPRAARVLTLAQPRTLGHVFNPISVHWLLDDDDVAGLVLAEVHNTYSGRHVYPVRRDAEHRASVDKAFPVSPFFTTAGRYEMRVSDPGERLEVAMTLALPAAATDPVTGAPEPAADPERATRPFTATLRGHRVPLTTTRVLTTVLRHTWPSLRTSVLIYRHGLQLWWHGRRRGDLPVQPHPHKKSWEGVR